MDNRIRLGNVVQDTVTGFQGVATGRAEYISSEPAVMVQPRVGADGKFVEPRWLDESRLVVIADAVTVAA